MNKASQPATSQREGDQQRLGRYQASWCQEVKSDPAATHLAVAPITFGLKISRPTPPANRIARERRSEGNGGPGWVGTSRDAVDLLATAGWVRAKTPLTSCPLAGRLLAGWLIAYNSSVICISYFALIL